MVDNRYRVNADALFSLKYHLGWCPKYRKRILTNALEKRLRKLLKELKFTFWLVQNFGLIGVGNLHGKGLASGMLAKSVHDVAWAAFFSKLAYKAENAGRRLMRNGVERTLGIESMSAPLADGLRIATT